MIERTERTITTETHDNGNTSTTSRTDARYTLTKINWVRVKHEGGAVTHTGYRAGWTFAIHTPAGGWAKMTGHHEDGRNVKGSYLTISGAKEAALFSMRPDEAMAWTTDRRNNAAVFKVARWGGFSFTYYGTQLRVANALSDTTEFIEVADFTEAREAAKNVLRGVYGDPAPVTRSEGPDTAAEALRVALATAGVRITPKQLAEAASVLATYLHETLF